MAIIERFREWHDDEKVINNSNISIKLIRALIRFSVRFLGIKKAIGFLKIINKNLFNKKINNDNLSYMIYLVEINLLRLDIILTLPSKNLSKYIKAKLKLCNYIISNSHNNDLIKNSKLYKLLFSNKAYQNNDFELNIPRLKKVKKEKFYIYGPNTKSKPNKKYSDYTIIFTKPYSDKIEKFKKSILFLNAFYYTNAIKNNLDLQKSILNKYSECIVHSKHLDLVAGFKGTSCSLAQGHVASLMALGRLLCYLTETYDDFDCVIEGFDFYLEKYPYQNLNHPKKLTNYNNRTASSIELEYCISLVDHDFMFNFVITKKLLENINLIDSADFKKIIQLKSREYADRLFQARDFSTLNYL